MTALLYAPVFSEETVVVRAPFRGAIHTGPRSPEVGSLPDFAVGNDAFPVVDCVWSGFVGIVVILRVQGMGMWMGLMGRSGSTGWKGRECSAPLGSLRRPLAMFFGRTSFPFRILGPGPRLALGLASAALPCTPVVADAIVNSGKSLESAWIQSDAMKSHRKCMVSLFLCQTAHWRPASSRNGWGRSAPGCHTTWEGIAPVPISFPLI